MKSKDKRKYHSIKKIVEAQTNLLSKCSNIEDHDPSSTCWACGWTNIIPERAHITGIWIGGDSDPTDFILLCPSCHKEQPDHLLKDSIISWLCTHEHKKTISTKLVDKLYIGFCKKISCKIDSTLLMNIFFDYWNSYNSYELESLYDYAWDKINTHPENDKYFKILWDHFGNWYKHFTSGSNVKRDYIIPNEIKNIKIDYDSPISINDYAIETFKNEFGDLYLIYINLKTEFMYFVGTETDDEWLIIPNTKPKPYNYLLTEEEMGWLENIRHKYLIYWFLNTKKEHDIIKHQRLVV
jgi:hypothetical protein